MNNIATIGHNSVQIPHDGKLAGASFGKRKDEKKRPTAFFRATSMSEAMAKAGIIPGTHMVRELAASALVRRHDDHYNQKPSRFLAL